MDEVFPLTPAPRGEVCTHFPSPLAGEGQGEGCLPNPIGLAAGYDRSGALLPQIAVHGFGFVELGTVTPHPVADHNPGVAVLAANVERWRSGAGHTRCAVGVSLGRQPGAPIEQAGRDFEEGMRAVWRCADYLSINLSGPANRALLEAGHERGLRDALKRVRERQQRLAAETGQCVPIFIKVPLLPGAEAPVVRYCCEIGFGGLIAALEDLDRAEAMRALNRLSRTLRGMTLIAVGGIRTAEHARACFAAGAQLVQICRAYAEGGQRAVAALAGCCGPG